MNALAKRLGLSEDLQFYDVYSLDEPEMLAHIPRPVYALLVIMPFTDAWARDREREDSTMTDYTLSGDQESVIWFKQTIGEACGSIGLLHCAINGPASKFILPGTTLEKLRADAIPLTMADRAQMLYDSQEFEDAHQSVATLGDTEAPALRQDYKLGQHFVAFVKADDGHLWELEGSRKGPLDRGLLGDDEDLLSPRALDLGLRRVMNIETAGGGSDLRFSCIALAPRST